MWLCVDRIEGDTVILVDDREEIYRLSRCDYVTRIGLEPAESAVLKAEVGEGKLLTAAYDEEETCRRAALARARLERLFGTA